jgi:spore coat polysaccharide biosynthesis protein SpsF (cytidylyltransferase family)
MHEHGGLWFDFDILFIKPLPSFFFESEDTDLFYFLWFNSDNSYYTFTTGFAASIPKLPFFTELSKRALQALKTTTSTNYMKIGPELWRQTFLDMDLFNDPKLKRVSNQTVYPYDWLQIPEFVTTNIDRVSNETFCIHWFNGNNEIRKIENEIDIETIDKTKSTLHKYLYNVFTTSDT